METKFSTCHTLANVLSTQSLLFFLQLGVKEFQSSQPQKDVASTWGFKQLLLTSTAVALHPLATDELRLVCHFQAKVQQNIVHDASTNVKQELMMASILSPVHVDPDKAKGAQKAAPRVVKLEQYPYEALLHFVGLDKVEVWPSADVFPDSSFQRQTISFCSQRFFVQVSSLSWS